MVAVITTIYAFWHLDGQRILAGTIPPIKHLAAYASDYESLFTRHGLLLLGILLGLIFLLSPGTREGPLA